ncbi:hypothetical protein [Aliivibrio sifiae]|uniref:Uncharacterized protein n=1 Tax=Aliivibrio sifiae TaxID=566293 RepID=A0A2S7XLC2_9GAMM|nr:hypothetical protein [Aliivibrio sifiae]PQJ94446.1 hypothetical protein BTO23_10410 [Aliivibrio sifiae]GLR75750.1 hypothetical protein GCM10007855_26240 [Aliivibrio sifiae]
MSNVTQIKTLLAELVSTTQSPIYAVCDAITSYLEQNPRQKNLTIGGLRAALNRAPSGDSELIQAAYALTANPFDALEVRYKLYDDSITDVIDELDQHTYMVALNEQQYIDNDGNILKLEELNSRVFPYFVNRLQVPTNPLSLEEVGHR